MAKIALKGTGDIDEVVSTIIKKVSTSIETCELVDRSRRDDIELLIFEKHYFRSSSRASLSVMVTKDELNTIYIDAISSGAGDILFKFSWGAEDHYIRRFKEVMENNGFVTISYN